MILPLPAYMATCEMACPGSAKNMRSPGMSAPNSAGNRTPTPDCSRAVRGSVTPCLAKMNFTNPEQSNPSLGVLPPQVYRTPTYESATRRRCAALADAAGEDGIDRLVAPPTPPQPPPAD